MTTLCTQKIKFCTRKLFLKNVCSNTYFDAVKKKQKKFGAISKFFWGRFELKFVVVIKKRLVMQFPYMEIA